MQLGDTYSRELCYTRISRASLETHLPDCNHIIPTLLQNLPPNSLSPLPSFRYEEEISKRIAAENEFVVLKKVRRQRSSTRA